MTGENNAGKSNIIHALRLILDSKLSAASRRLVSSDFHCDSPPEQPTQVLVAVALDEIAPTQRPFTGLPNPALPQLGTMIAFRFKPRQYISSSLNLQNEYSGDELSVDDYEVELVRSLNADPTTVAWHEPLGDQLKLSDLDNFTVEYLSALRDVESDLRQARSSPLAKLIELSSIPSDEKTAIENAFSNANGTLRNVKTISEIAKGMKNEFINVAGDVTGLNVEVGVADPSFSRLAKTLTVIFDGAKIGTLDLARNGLGVNNLLYTSMIIDCFKRRIRKGRTPGQLLLIDEPEAHLHPQAQRVLYSSLSNANFQTVVATHSPHIASQSPLLNQVNIIRRGHKSEATDIHATHTPAQISDLERYLDATRSSLLFSRHVILVEGPAELFIIPKLAKQVMQIDFDRKFITVIPIFGTHFASYTPLFDRSPIGRKCAIIADGDQKNVTNENSEIISQKKFMPAESKHVKIFLNQTTFEKTLAMPGLLSPLHSALVELNSPKRAQTVSELIKTIDVPSNAVGENSSLAALILSAASENGKARFAQVYSKYLNLATDLPEYIRQAVTWITETDLDENKF